jgi:threonine dehydratase
MKPYIDQVREARNTISGVAIETPLCKSQVLTEVMGFEVYLKLENLQVTGAFKIRGCYNKMSRLDRRGKGIIAASSGSHGIASALAAKLLGIPATVVMPAASPEIKRKRVKGYGANLVIHGETYDDAYDLAKEMAAAEGKVFVPSFDDIDIIIGQGTIALEILDALPDADFIGCPVGGGGLYAGMLLAVKATRPDLPVWGVQAEGAASGASSMASGRIERLDRIGTIADAIAVKSPGRVPFEIIKEKGDGIAVTTDARILQATGQLALWAKVLAEPAGAAALAVDWPAVTGRTPRKAVFVVSGGNISRAALATALESCEEYPSM